MLSLAAVYFEVIPAGLLGVGGGEGKRAADRPRAEVARVKPKPRAEVEVVHREEDGEKPSTVAAPIPSKAAEPVAPKSPLMVEYEAKARGTPDTPEAQKKLARWCEEQELAIEARSHWEAVVRLRPDDEAARGKLGFRKRGGTWKTEAMIAEEQEQARADKKWFATLTNLHKRMHATDLDAEAVAGRRSGNWAR